MAQRLSILLALFFSIFLMAQNQRFMYEYRFSPDSLNKGFVLKEIMNLDVTKEGSVFYSNVLLDKDSVFNEQYNKGKTQGHIVLDFSKVKKTTANFVVSKSYPKYETALKTSFNALHLIVKEEKQMQWNILPDTKVIEGYKVQKATTNFAGRDWIAWFTNDIQIQDGPYKFHGLPGLILSVADEAGDHNFNIIAIKKQYARTYAENSKKNQVYVTATKFNQLWNDYKKDPAKNIKIIHSSSEMSDTIFFNSNTGQPMTKQELIRNKEEGDKKYFKYYNNFIERNLYKQR